MVDEPHVWHYGLVAEMWSAGERGTRELDFLQTLIVRVGQPALDLGCGAGRLLVPLRQAGIEVDGVDISQDMLAVCKAKLEAKGLDAGLHASPMHALALPRSYRVIFLADSFGLAGSRALDEQALARIYAQLEPGGVLVFNKEAPYALDEWAYFPSETRAALPEPWPEEPGRRQGEDGIEYLNWLRLAALDPLEQTYRLEMRVQKQQAGEVLGEEVRTLRGTLYLRNELVAMLEKTGFSRVDVLGGYTDHSATTEDEEFVYLAAKGT